MAKLDLGSINGPIEIPDELLNPLKAQVSAGTITAAQGVVSLYDQIDSEAKAAFQAGGGGSTGQTGYNSVLAKYGLANPSAYATLAGQAADLRQDPNATNALSAFLTGTAAPTVYAPGSLQEGSANSITKEWPDVGGVRPPDQSVNPINVNPTNDAGRIAYNQRLAGMNSGVNNGAGAPATPIASQTPPAISVASIKKGLNDLLAGINTNGITDANGKVLLAPGQTNVQTGQMGTISSSSLRGNKSPLTIANSTSNSSLADSTVAGAEASLKSINDYIKLLTPPESTSSNKVKDLIGKIEGDLEGLKGRGDAQLQAEQAQQVEQKKQTLLNYQTELQVKTAEYKAIQAKYAALNAETEGKAITMNSIIGAQAQTNKMALAELNSKAAEIAMVQANISGAQGNLTLAQDAANRSVDLKYSDAKDMIELQLKQLELLEGESSKEEKIRSDAITLYMNDQKTALATAQAYEKDKNATLLNQMQKYPDAGISLNDTLESANQKITSKSSIYQKEKTPGTTGVETVSGGLRYSAQDAGEDSQALEASRGADNYVDPTIYLNLYNAWISNGGLLKDFLSIYPPKFYVNPANTWLPSVLMPANADDGNLF